MTDYIKREDALRVMQERIADVPQEAWTGSSKAELAIAMQRLANLPDASPVSEEREEMTNWKEEARCYAVNVDYWRKRALEAEKRAPQQQAEPTKPAFWARLLNGELDDHSDYCVATDPNDLGDGDEGPGITIVPVWLDPPRIGNGIEPRGCPTPGACSCYAAPPPDDEAARLLREALIAIGNLTSFSGHESPVLKQHPRPCKTLDFCVVRDGQKRAELIAEYLARKEPKNGDTSAD